MALALALLGQFPTATQAAAAGYKQADKTGASIAEFRDEIVNVKKAIDVTMASLSQVVTEAAIDPRAAFQEFERSIPQVYSAATKAKKRAEEMKARGQDYFTQWEKELAAVNNPEIRKLAAEPKAKLQEVFGKLKSVMEPVRNQFIPWLADLKDLQAYLSNDLTISGIDAAKELIAKTMVEGQRLQLSMENVVAELNTIVATLTPAKPKKK